MDERAAIRQRAASRMRDVTDFALARMLREVRQSNAHRAWGYRSFRAYLKGDLGLSKSRAYELIDILDRFEGLGLSSHDIDDIGRAAGSSKLVLLLSLITPGNQKKFFANAATMTRRELQERIGLVKGYLNAA